MLNMSSLTDVFLGISAILKEYLPTDAPYFIKENLWMSASDEAKLKC